MTSHRLGSARDLCLQLAPTYRNKQTKIARPSRRVYKYEEADSVYSPRVPIVSTCCNRVRVRSQLNGANGEATNKDDVRGERRVDKRQDKQLQRLLSRMQKLEVNRKSRKPKNKKTRTKSAKISSAQPKAIKQEPTAVSVQAQVAPFDIPRGIASVLKGPRPSQKITSRALCSVIVTNGQNMLGFFSPCIASDTGYYSGLVHCGSTTQMSAAPAVLTSGDAIVLWTGVSSFTLSTNTPYTAATLAGNDYRWRLVSYGLRIRNTTASMYRGGVIKYLVDTGANLMPADASTSQTFQATITAMDANHKTVRYNCASRPDIEIAVPHSQVADAAWHSIPSTDPASFGNLWYEAVSDGAKRAGGTLSTNYAAYGQLYISYINGTGQTQNFDLELIEHWEIAGSAIEILHTPSASHSGAYDLVSNIANHSHHQHSLAPHLTFKSVVKDAVKLEHNKAAMQDAGIAATALLAL